MRSRLIGGLLPSLLLWGVCGTAQAQDFTYTIVNGESITITGYTGTDTEITIPERIENLPVTTIGNEAFRFKNSLTSITIPGRVTCIGEYAFAYSESLMNVTIPSGVNAISDFAFAHCSSLGGLYFEGNAPDLDGPYVLTGVDSVHVYYLPGSSCWDVPFAGFTPELWDPQTGDISTDLGAGSNQFGFSITGADGMACNVEASDDLTTAIWTKLETLTLTGGTAQFSDPDW